MFERERRFLALFWTRDTVKLDLHFSLLEATWVWNTFFVVWHHIALLFLLFPYMKFYCCLTQQVDLHDLLSFAMNGNLKCLFYFYNIDKPKQNFYPYIGISFLNGGHLFSSTCLCLLKLIIGIDFQRTHVLSFLHAFFFITKGSMAIICGLF